MVPSLVDLCIKKWIDNVGILADVGKIDEYLLDSMLPLCSVDQLKYVEGSTKGIDLSPVTDKYWKTFYEKHFGNTDGVIEKMRKNEVPFKWKQAYEYKEKEIKARKQMRRLVLEEYENDYCGAGYYGSNSTARQVIGFLNSEEDEEEEEEVEEEEDEETNIEEFLERVVGGEVFVEEDEETDIEEFLERVVGVVPVEDEDEETDVEEELEEEEHTQIEEGEDDRNESEVGQEENGYGDDYYDDGYGGDYGCDDGYGCDYDCDDFDEYY